MEQIPEEQRTNSPSVRTSGNGSITHHTVLNLASTVGLLLVTLVAVPPLVGALGQNSFGLLSLLWTFIGYFSLLDLGVSRAATKYVSESMARNDIQAARRFISSSLFISVVFGIVIGALILPIRDQLCDLLSVPYSMRGEARNAFTFAAFSFPFVLAGGVHRGIQMALFRFDAANLIQLVSGILQWVGGAVLAVLGLGVSSIVLLTLTIRIGGAVFSSALLPALTRFRPYTLAITDRRTIGALARFGGWTGISQLISPLFSSLDRILISSLISIGAVTYYSIPQDALNRILYLALGFTSALFPAAASEATRGDGRSNLTLLYRRSVLIVGTIFALGIGIIITFSREILTVWLGGQFAEKSTPVLTILAVGTLFNTIAQLPYTVLHALGKPNVTARFHVGELILFTAFLYLMIPWIGINGAALAWTARCAIDAFLLFIVAERSLRVGTSRTVKPISAVRGLLFISGAVITTAISLEYVQLLLVKIAAYCTISALLGYLTWTRVFGADERSTLLRLPKKIIS